MRRNWVISLASAVACACSTGTGPATSSRVAGSWSYAGTQQTPAAATLEGSVSWRGIGDGSNAYEGTFSVVERQSSGAVRSLTGPSAGQLLSDSIADFNLFVQGVARRHIGVVRADSISGNWASLDAGTGLGGRFIMRRMGQRE